MENTTILVKPLILDETGKAIVEALTQKDMTQQRIKEIEAATDEQLLRIPEVTELSADVDALSESITEIDDVVYRVHEVERDIVSLDLYKDRYVLGNNGSEIVRDDSAIYQVQCSSIISITVKSGESSIPKYPIMALYDNGVWVKDYHADMLDVEIFAKEAISDKSYFRITSWMPTEPYGKKVIIKAKERKIAELSDIFTVETETEEIRNLILYKENAFLDIGGSITVGRQQTNIYMIDAKDVKSLRVNRGESDLTRYPVACLYENETLITSYGYNEYIGKDIDFSNVSSGSILITGWTPAEPYYKTVTYTEEKCLFAQKDDLNSYVNSNPFKDKMIYFFGDSITVGYTSGTTTTQNGFVKHFCDTVGAKFINYGIAGSSFCDGYSYNDSIKTIPQRIKEIDLSGADYVFICGGVNDCQIGATETDFKNAIADLMLYLKDNCSCPIIFVTPINFSKTFTLKVFDLDVYRNYIKLYAITNGYKCVDTSRYGFPSGTSATETELATLLFGDGLHPTELGHKMYGLALANDFSLLN